MSEERDRQAADIWSRGPEREVRWLPPTPDRTPAPVHGPRYERTDDALRIIYWVFAGVALVTAAGIVSDALELNLANRLLDGEAVTPDERDGNDLRVGIVSGVEGLALIVGACAWIAWFHAAYRNAGALGAERRHGEGWAIGAWFVPILNLWRPKQIANDLWAAGEPGADPKQPPPLLLWWWLAWLFGGQSGLAFRSDIGGDATDEELRAYAIVGIGVGVLSLAAAALACVAAARIQARLVSRAAAGTRAPFNHP